MSHPRLWPRVMSRFTAILQLGSALKSVAQGPNGGHERADPSGMVTGELVLPLTGHLSRTAVPTPSTGPMRGHWRAALGELSPPTISLCNGRADPTTHYALWRDGTHPHLRGAVPAETQIGQFS